VNVPEFRTDLFRGVARDYDRFRLGYPAELTDELAQRSGHGRLLDLACGTGQLTFALHDRFDQTWAVDQEPDMIEVVTEKAAGIGSIRPMLSSAEDLAAPASSFDLVVLGNAFHRLHRDVVAARILGWLRPGGLLALVWSAGPTMGDAPWQRALRDCLARWSPAGRVPADYEQDRNDRPDLVILTQAGFEPDGQREFFVDREWTTETVTGFVLATSVLSRAVLGDRAAAFEAELRGELTAREPAGRFRQRISFSYDLARKPGQAHGGHV
jgi:SAM-dependent methyltransferase